MLKKSVLLINLLLIILMALSAMAPQIHPESMVIPAIIAGAFPLYIILTLTFLILYAVMKPVYVIIPMMMLVAFWSPISSHLNLRLPDKVSNTSLGVASFNLFGLKAIKKQGRASMYDELKSLMDVEQLDVICLQECNGFSNKVIDSVLEFNYEYQYLNSGVRILSQHEIKDRGTFDFDSRVNSCIWADIDVEGKKLRLYCAHLQSNRVGDRANEIIEKGNLTEKNTWLGVRNIMGRYKLAALERQAQANRIKTHAMVSEYPVILCGDLNDHPLSYPVQELSEGWKDTFDEKGTGWGTTYAGRLPLLRIDYIMTDSSFTVYDHDVVRNGLSDHHFVRAVVEMKE